MKSTIATLLVFASVQVSAAQDSVAVFFNPQKTVVLIMLNHCFTSPKVCYSFLHVPENSAHLPATIAACS